MGLLARGCEACGRNGASGRETARGRLERGPAAHLHRDEPTMPGMAEREGVGEGRDVWGGGVEGGERQLGVDGVGWGVGEATR